MNTYKTCTNLLNDAIFMLYQRLLSDSILNKCYSVSYLHIVQLTIETMLSLSEMYHNTFTNRKKYNFLCRRLIKRAKDKLNMQTYYLLSLCSMLIYYLCKLRYLLLCLLYCPYNYYFISTVDYVMYAFLSLYPDVFTTHLLFNAHKKNQLAGFLQQFV